MDKNLMSHGKELRIRKQNKDTTSFWMIWSKAVERGFLQYLDVRKVFDRKCKGRGEATFIKSKNQTDGKKKGEDRTRGVESTAAAKAIKHARRCVQVAFRLGLIR